MASGVSVDRGAVESGIRACNAAIQGLRAASDSLLRRCQNAGAGGWRDRKYTDLCGITDDCRQALEQPISQLEACATKLEALARAVAAYEETVLQPGASGESTSGSGDFQSSMNTAGELAQIREMEANGEFEFSALDRLNASQVLSGSRLPGGPISVELPANTARYSMEGFAEQVLMQEEGLNSLSVYDFLTNYENRHSQGRDPESVAVQRQYRLALTETLTEEYMGENPGLSPEQARTDAESCVRLLAALHNPDQAAGGSGFGVTAAGSRQINSALGSLWGHGRARALYEEVLARSSGWSEEQMRNTYLNVRLRVTDRNS